MGTIYSFYEELSHWGYPFEIIVVSNLSTDNTTHILRDRMRRWVRGGLLKVIDYDDKPANVMVRNVGARAADGDVVFLADAHLSVQVGTLHRMIQGWLEHGGLWHSATNIWGDTSDLKCYGYKLRLEQKFWGNLSQHLPDRAKTPDGPIPHRVPMASHCCLMAGREEYLEKGGYHPDFRCYGGGEPYLDLKWWLLGGEVWIEPRGLIRHAFGTNGQWKKVNRDKEMGNAVWVRNKGITKEVKKGEEYLHYSRGYSFTNEQLHFNFMLAAYTVGGYKWLQKIYENYWEVRKGNPRYLDDLKVLRRDAIVQGTPDRKFIRENQKLTLDELIAAEPWAA